MIGTLKLTKTNKARARFYGGVSDSFQADILYIGGDQTSDLSHHSLSLNHWATTALKNNTKEEDMCYARYSSSIRVKIINQIFLELT